MRGLIVGANQIGGDLLQSLHATKRMEVIAIIDEDRYTSGIDFSRKYNISFDVNWRNWINKDIDLIVESTGEVDVINTLKY